MVLTAKWGLGQLRKARRVVTFIGLLSLHVLGSCLSWTFVHAFAVGHPAALNAPFRWLTGSYVPDSLMWR